MIYLLSILLSFYIESESITPYTLTSSTRLPARFSSSSSSIVTPTPTVTEGK